MRTQTAMLAPQRARGCQNLTMTMRYAHVSPDHVSQTRKRNPLRALSLWLNPTMQKGLRLRATP